MKNMKFLYHVDRNDISTYDLVINLKKMSMSSACDLICQNASLPEYQPSPESQKRLGDLVLAATTYWLYLVHLWLMFVLLIYAPFPKSAHLIYRTLAMTYAKQTRRGVEELPGLFARP
jgi:hypothetical protein